MNSFPKPFFEFGDHLPGGFQSNYRIDPLTLKWIPYRYSQQASYVKQEDSLTVPAQYVRDISIKETVSPDQPLDVSVNPLPLNTTGGVPDFFEGKLKSRILKLEEAVNRLDGYSYRLNDHIANLAVNHAKDKSRIDKLEMELAEKDLGLRTLADRIAFLEEEAMVEKSVNVDTSESHTLGARFRLAYSEERQDVIDRLREDLDKIVWPIFDAAKGLGRAGGHYVIQNVMDDLLAVNPSWKRHDFDVDFEDIVDSALRWSKSRTRWYYNVRYWVKQVGPFVILKRNRFAFQKEDGSLENTKALL